MTYDGKGLSYDDVGNPLSDGTWTYTWEQGRQLASMSYANNNWLFTYDANGMRTSRRNQVTTYTYWYHGSQLSYMTYGSNAMKFTYGADGSPLAVDYNGTTYYYVVNLQGDVVAILNSTGQKVVGYTYDAWGRLLTTTGTLKDTLGLHNPLRYRGYVYDQETGLYYLESRYYNPTIGRFINADNYPTTGQGLLGNNMFAYCNNNPVIRADSGGEFWHIVAGAVVGGLISGAIKVVANAIEGNDLTDGLGIAMLSGAASGALAATGVGVVGMIAGNAAISMAENAVNQIIDNKGFSNFDVGDMMVDCVIGGISGALGGAGKGSKHLTNLGKQTVKRTINVTTHKGINAGIKEAGKAFSYYAKNSAKYYGDFVRGVPGDVLSSIATTIVSSDYMKHQYSCLFGG